jgi:hypothetical protein
MERHAASTVRARLGAFLDSQVGTPHEDDVGALLGQAALIFASPVAGFAEPDDWREAVSAALGGGSSAEYATA